MFSNSSFQPQVLAAVSQISSLVNGLRTLSSGTRTAGRPRQEKATCSQEQAPRVAASSNPSSLPTTLVSDCGLTDLEEVRTEDVVTLLASSPASSPPRRCLNKDAKTGWSQSFVSADSFFENRTGFPQSQQDRDLAAVTAWHLFQSQPIQSLLSRHLSSHVYQQQRGFRTRENPVGIGGVAKRDSVINDLRKSVFARLFPEKKALRQNERFHKLVGEHNDNPEVQEKLRLAFAEGYQASSRTETTDSKNSFLSRTFRFVFYLCILWMGLQFLQVFSAVGGGGGGMRGLGVLNREQFELNPEEINITFDDVKGVDEAKQELKDVVEFLRDPDKFTSLGAKLPKGVLLVGPPGIGKTLLARAVAGEAGVPFFHASGSEFDEIFVGTGAKRVRQLFGAAKIRAPCVIFIDEIDSVGAKRTSSQIHPYANQTINQLLSEMDGFTQNEGVIVLGATNRRDNLDRALLRPGRFDVEVRVFPPDLKGRSEILTYYLSKIKRDTDIDVMKIARGTTGFTGADLENMVNQAALKAAIDGAPAVDIGHLDFARDKILMGPAKKSKIIDDDTNWYTAYHEAGHTLVAFFSKDATPLHKVTIIPRGMSLGHTSFIEDKEVFNKTKAQLLAEMDVAMGGRAAEELIYGADKVTTGAASDFQQATSIATAMVKKLGMSEKIGQRVFEESEGFDGGLSMLKVNEVSPAIQEVVDSEIKRILSESYERAKQILKSHASEHKALAQALMKYETLDKEDIQAIVEGRTVNKPL